MSFLRRGHAGWRRLLAVAVILLLPASAWAAAGGGHGDLTHRMMILMVQLGVILLAAKFGHVLIAKTGMPGVLGEVFAGILIGPYLAGAFPLPGLPHGLFATAGDFPISPELYGICVLASVVLLFMVGLETDLRMFMRYSAAASVIGISGVIASFVLGDLVAMAFSAKVMGEPLGFFAPPCLMLGVISTATSVGITASILVEKRKMDAPEGVTILAAAVVDDVLGIIMLAVTMGMITASQSTGHVDWGHIGMIALKVVGLWMGATITGLLASRRISTLLKSFGEHSTIAVLALGIALIVAGLFEQAGLAMIIGAYVAGLSLSQTDIRHVIREHTEPAYALLVPIFFAVMGMLVNLKAMLAPEILGFGVVFTLVAIVSKVLGCGLPALLCNFNLRGALRIGCGMLPRGEVALLISGTALAAGMLSQELFGVVIMTTLVTTVIAPPLLVRLFRSQVSGVRRATTDSAIHETLFTFPSEETASFLLTRLLHVFESDGFFVHELSRRERAYQLLRDRMVINLQRHGAVLKCTCGGGETAVLNAAMLEVLANFEHIVRQLRQPVDSRAISRGVQAPAGSPQDPTILRQSLAPAVLRPRLKARTRDEAIDELLDLLQTAGCVRDPVGAREAIMERERNMSTGMQHGIAIPHGRTDAVDALVSAIGMNPDGIDYPSLDGQPVRIVILTLSPRKAPTPYVQFLAAISQKLDAEGRRELLECRTAEAMYAMLVRSPRETSGQKG